MGPYLNDQSSWETDRVCAQCGEPLLFTEEVWLLTIVLPHIHENQLLLTPCLDDEGEFLYDPYLVHFSCWEEIEEDLREEVENTPPIVDGLAPLRCKICESSIREWELAAAFSLGELHVSKKSPEPTGRGIAFVPSGEPDLVCLYCMHLINEDHLEFWENGVAQEGECADCLHIRCWRSTAAGVPCVCTCHAEEHEESTT